MAFIGDGFESTRCAINKLCSNYSPASPHSLPSSPQIQFLEEIIPFVVDDDEGGEVLDVDAPDRRHAEVLKIDACGLLDAVLA